MQIVTSHTNTDFDALASMVACTCLYPGTIGILPSHIMPGVKAFLSIHQDLLRLRPRKECDLNDISSLVVVDTNNWKRLDRMAELAHKDDLGVISWDHHMEGTTIESTLEYREEVGATITLLLEEMERQNTPFTPMQATLFLLGIYDDTGCMTFSSATPRDARMTAFLMENGADLNVVSAYLAETIDESHSQVFSDMLAQAHVLEVDGLNVGICALTVQSGLTMLASLVSKYKEFKGLDGAFGIFLTDQSKVMVIARGNPQGIDVGAVVRALGGGGHPAAGSAVVKGSTLETVQEQVEALVREASQKEVLVRDIMSESQRFTIGPDLTMAQAGQIMDRAGLKGILVCNDNQLLGMLSRSVVAKAQKNNRLETSVKGGIKPRVPMVEAMDNARHALEQMNQSHEGILPVMEKQSLIGVLTRGNLVLHMYDI